MVEVDDEKVDEALELASRARILNCAAKLPKRDDRVKIDFIGRIDGEAFEGGTAEGFDPELVQVNSPALRTSL